MPQQNLPYVTVRVSYPGASPSDMESLVAKPIENAVAGAEGINSIQSTCSQGSAMVFIQFSEDTDNNQAAIEVQRRVSSIRSNLPKDAGDPTVSKIDPNSMPMMNIVVTSPSHSSDDLYQTVSDVVQPALQALPGVADVSISGGRDREIQVQLDMAKMEGFEITVDQITGVLSRENVNVPAGSVEQGRQSLAVRSMGLFQSLTDLGNVIISYSDAGPIRLKEVANIIDTYKNRTRYQRFNGQDAIGLNITKQNGANQIKVSEAVSAKVKELKQELPTDATIIISNDDSTYTKASLDAVIKDLMISVVLCGAVLLLFLHTWRNTLIVILAIPTSLISTFLVMYALGFSLNTMSLLALALMIGILVDDSIVVLENIHRHLQGGEKPREAALKGRSEIGMAAMAITFVDVVVYLPVAFMSGNVGRMFKEYGITIASATLFSLFVSFTLTPMLASRFSHKEEFGGRGLWARFTAAWERGFERMSEGYGHVVGWALHAGLLVIAVGFLAVAGALAMVWFNIIGSEYSPQEDDSKISINVQMPSSTKLDVTNASILQLEKMLREQVPEISSIYTTVGSGGGPFGSSGRSGSLTVRLVDKNERSRTIWQIMSQVRTLAAAIPEMSAQVSSSGGIAGMGPGGNMMMIRVAGSDADTLTQVASRVEQVARGVPGIMDVRSGASASDPELQTSLNRNRMGDLGITATQVATTLRAMVSGSVASRYQPTGRTQVDINVIAANSGTKQTSEILNTLVAFRNGVSIRLKQIADIQMANSPTEISRQDRKRQVSLTGIISGRSTGDVARDFRAQVALASLPAGYTVTLMGQVNQMEETFAKLLSALALSIIMIYMLLVALYGSWTYPLAIMFSLPVSLVGAFGGLFLTGNTFNLFSLIGIIMLMGLVAKNAILLVDYTNTLRGRGMQREQALMVAGRTRLRPILMTTMTIVVAMIPLALKMEAGAESRAPMAIVVIGGVLSSTLLTLVLVPVMYTILDNLQERLGLHPFAAVGSSGVSSAALSPISGGSDESNSSADG
jgi:HAE1 family hydrophobic/amphiphilic exporter-1